MIVFVIVMLYCPKVKKIFQIFGIFLAIKLEDWLYFSVKMSTEVNPPSVSKVDCLLHEITTQ